MTRRQLQLTPTLRQPELHHHLREQTTGRIRLPRPDYLKACQHTSPSFLETSPPRCWVGMIFKEKLQNPGTNPVIMTRARSIAIILLCTIILYVKGILSNFLLLTLLALNHPLKIGQDFLKDTHVQEFCRCHFAGYRKWLLRSRHRNSTAATITGPSSFLSYKCSSLSYSCTNTR